MQGKTKIFKPSNDEKAKLVDKIELNTRIFDLENAKPFVRTKPDEENTPKTRNMLHTLTTQIAILKFELAAQKSNNEKAITQIFGLEQENIRLKNLLTNKEINKLD